jgi:hypothetical protein
MRKRKRKERYSPLARLPKRIRWDDEEMLRENMLEKDPYTDAAGLIERLGESGMVSIEQLEGLTNVLATGELPF